MTDHATRARELCTIGEHDGFACLFIGGLPMYHAGTVEQIGHQMDRLLPLIAAALTRAAEEAVQRRQETVAMCDQLRQELQAAQPVWGDKPTVAGGYWVRHDGYEQVMNVKAVEGCGFVVGPYFKPLEECDGWEFAGPIPLPREANE